MDFASAISPEAYVTCQGAVVRKNLAYVQAWLPPPVQTSLEVFVLMPFSTAWSDATYRFVLDVARRLGDSVRIYRADEITETGRITQQIVSSIQQADALVADITGLNPNVMWELGYAHALDKKVVILTQDVDAAPFDLLDYRQVSYRLPASEDDALAATAFLATALGITLP